MGIRHGCSGSATLRRKRKRKRVPVDVPINNDGVLEQGAFAAIPAVRHQALIDLKVFGMTAMRAAFLLPMIARGSGRGMNVASLAAFQPAPGLATHAATKACVLSLTSRGNAAVLEKASPRTPSLERQGRMPPDRGSTVPVQSSQQRRTLRPAAPWAF